MHTLGVFILRRTMRRLGQRSDRALRRFIVSMSAAHLWIYRRSGGMFGGRLGLRRAEIVLLTTRGRRTGQPRTVPLLALRQGGDLVVIASYGGLGQPPEWWLNLSADAEAIVETRGLTVAVVAETCEPLKRDELWLRFVGAFGGYEDYRGRTTREFPIVVLHPMTCGGDERQCRGAGV
jgi:deazaflavin-dependent oxidoreductase (nitroreductase family)